MQSTVLPSILLSSIGPRLPEVIALLVGIVVAIVHWRHGGRKAALALSGFVLALLGVVLSVASTLLVVVLQAGAGFSVASASPVIGGVGLLVGLLTAAAWVLITLALFTGKQPSPAEG